MNWALGIRMVSSSATLTQRGILCTPLITLLTVSSMVALIVRLAFPTTLQGCMPASTSHVESCLTSHPLSFISHCQHYVPCRVSPLQYPDHGLCGCHPTCNSIVRLSFIESTCSRPRLTLLSKLSPRLAYISLCYPAPERAVCAVAFNNVLLCRSGRTTGVPPERS